MVVLPIRSYVVTIAVPNPVNRRFDAYICSSSRSTHHSLPPFANVVKPIEMCPACNTSQVWRLNPYSQFATKDLYLGHSEWYPCPFRVYKRPKGFQKPSHALQYLYSLKVCDECLTKHAKTRIAAIYGPNTDPETTECRWNPYRQESDLYPPVDYYHCWRRSIGAIERQPKNKRITKNESEMFQMFLAASQLKNLK